MNAFAERLDPCVNWFRVLARTKGRILWLFPAILLAGYLISLLYGDPVGGFLERLNVNQANAPLLSQARKLDLDYEKVLAKPEDYVGKPVVWCVTTPAIHGSYVSGRPSWPVALDAPFEEYKTNSVTSGGGCINVLAVITGYERGLIQLRPVEKL